jgi:ABC-type multidrug transport system ATPase subunit
MQFSCIVLKRSVPKLTLELHQAYVTQEIMLMSTLSVREAVYYSAQLQLPETVPAAKKRAHAERVIREMGLSDAMDTRIGGRITKGISGGQRKRLTICIEMLTRPRLLFLDEPTSGLDSAASYHVMSHIARIAAREGMTIVAAVHQPSGDVFELFHSLCLLAYGRTVFFGEAAHATEVSISSPFVLFFSFSNPLKLFQATLKSIF